MADAKFTSGSLTYLLSSLDLNSLARDITYFSLLPGDILKYFLPPYLKCNNWHSSSLIGRYSFRGNFTPRTVRVLRNGYLLVADSQAIFRLVDPWTGNSNYLFHNAYVFSPSFHYDRVKDILYLAIISRIRQQRTPREIKELEKADPIEWYAVPNFSNIRSIRQVVPANLPPEIPDYSFRPDEEKAEIQVYWGPELTTIINVYVDPPSRGCQTSLDLYNGHLYTSLYGGSKLEILVYRCAS